MTGMFFIWFHIELRVGTTASLAFDCFYYDSRLLESPLFNLYKLFSVFLNCRTGVSVDCFSVPMRVNGIRLLIHFFFLFLFLAVY